MKSSPKCQNYRLLLAASIGLTTCASAADGVFTWANIGSGDQDANVGLSSSKTYLNAVNTTGTSLTINGVQFENSSGTTPSGTNYSIAGNSGEFGSLGTNNVTNQLGLLLNGFIYNGNPSALTLNNLTAGQTYSLALYNRAFGSGDRSVNLTTGGGAAATFNQNSGGDGNLNLLRYTFTATGTSETVTFSPVNSGNTFHFYGFATEQTFNKSWISGADWTTATWSTAGAPNGVGANADFAAQGSPTSINLDAAQTVGHIRFAGTNSWTLSGANPLTLQADGGAVSVLAASSGTHTISTAVTLNSGLLKSGAGRVVLSGAVTDTGKGITLGDGTLEINSSSAQSFSSVISGSGSLAKTGNGTLTLSAASTYTGGTTISDGTLFLTYNSTFQPNTAIGPKVSTNIATINSGGTLTGNDNNWLSETSVASGGGNAISVVINSGGLLKGANNRITGLGNVTLNGGTIEVTNGLGGVWNASFTLGGDITVSGSAASSITTASGAGGAANIYMANGTNGTGGTRTFTVNDVTASSASDLIVSARLAKGMVIKAGAGTLELAAGITGTETPVSWQVDTGTLKITTNNVVGGAVTVNGGAFDIGTNSDNTVGVVTLKSGSISGTTGTLTGSSYAVESGSISAILGGSGALTKTTAGTVTLSGANTYGGITEISAGTLIAANNTALGTGGLNGATLTNIRDGGTLALQGGVSLDEHFHAWGHGAGGLGTVRSLSGNNALTLKDGSGNGGLGIDTDITVGVDADTLTASGFYHDTGSFGITKIGSGTLVLSDKSRYTGATNVNAGTLLVNGTTATGSAITVAAGSASGTPVAKLGGTGTIGGTVNLAEESSLGFKNGGVLAPTAAASGTKLSVTGTTTFGTGSIFEWNMSATNPATDPGAVANSGSYGQLAGNGAITGSNAVFKIQLGNGNSFTDAFWNTSKTWDNLFTGTGATIALTSIFSTISGTGITYESGQGTVAGRGYFTLSGTNTLNWTAVPEPTSALAGLLIGAGFLRRRRA